MNYLAKIEPINPDNIADRAIDTGLSIGLFALTAIGGLLGMIAIIGVGWVVMVAGEAKDRALDKRQSTQLQRDNQLRLARLAARGLPDRTATHHAKTDYTATNKETLT